MPVDRINVEGLDKLRKALAKADTSLSKEIGAAGKKAADLVAKAARPKVPVRSGAAARSMRAVTRRGGGGVAFGGARAPYAAFLDYGNKVRSGAGVGRGDSAPRAHRPGGRYVYPTLAAKRDEVIREYVVFLSDVLRRAGL